MSEAILRIEGLNMTFASGKARIRAVNDVNFEIGQGETIGIVGESGCGKTTLGRCIVRAYDATSGRVFYRAKDGREYNLQSIDPKTLRTLRKEIQMIFQDPYSSLDPRMTVYDIVSEPLRANFRDMPKKEMETRVKEISEKVGLNPSYLKRYPHAFSGGQRQRIGIARALVLYPRVIVCDEAVSALDVSVQAQVINLLKDLQREMDLTYIFISHDLSVVEHISDKVGVMYLGKMVEYAPAARLFAAPCHPYTEALISAVPIADPTAAMERIPLAGEIPNPAKAPGGCFFHTRCQYFERFCAERVPSLDLHAKGHYVACLRRNDLKLRGIPMEADAKT
jgi:peptide/nickel transport system ATP-binding protein